jgi:hypothetical protein
MSAKHCTIRAPRASRPCSAQSPIDYLAGLHSLRGVVLTKLKRSLESETQPPFGVFGILTVKLVEFPSTGMFPKEPKNLSERETDVDQTYNNDLLIL